LDEVEYLPGDFAITFRNLKKYRARQDFIIHKGGKPFHVEFSEEIARGYEYYFLTWEDYHYFGLPHGKGSLDELPWLLDFLKYFDRLFQAIENYRLDKRRG
jgi:hypothetical protein